MQAQVSPWWLWKDWISGPVPHTVLDRDISERDHCFGILCSGSLYGLMGALGGGETIVEEILRKEEIADKAINTVGLSGCGLRMVPPWQVFQQLDSCNMWYLSRLHRWRRKVKMGGRQACSLMLTPLVVGRELKSPSWIFLLGGWWI